MIKVIFDGFETPEQANAFINWFMIEGEMKTMEWMSENSDVAMVEGTHRYGNEQEKTMTLQIKLHKK